MSDFEIARTPERNLQDAGAYQEYRVHRGNFIFMHGDLGTLMMGMMPLSYRLGLDAEPVPLHKPHLGALPSFRLRYGSFFAVIPIWLLLSTVLGWTVFRELRGREKVVSPDGSQNEVSGADAAGVGLGGREKSSGKRKRKISAIGASVAALLLVYACWPRAENAEGNALVSTVKQVFKSGSFNAPVPGSFEAMEDFYHSPFVVYGKVVDENGAPIEGVTATARVSDGYMHSTTYKGTSGKDGLFVIKCSKGSSFSVTVSKPGYRRVENWPGHPNSTQHLDRDPTIITPHVSREDRPVILSLKKQGVIESLKTIGREPYLNEIRKRMEPNGFPLEIPFYIDGADSNRVLRVRCWVPNGTTSNADGHFSWRCEISAKDGSVIEGPNEFEYTAPEVGYLDKVAFEYPDSLPRGEWKHDATKVVFIRFSDQVHARVSMRISPSSPMVHISGHLNPKPGSRSLEIPVKKTVQEEIESMR